MSDGAVPRYVEKRGGKGYALQQLKNITRTFRLLRTVRARGGVCNVHAVGRWSLGKKGGKKEGTSSWVQQHRTD